METLANWFVQKPLNILAVAALFLVAWLGARYAGIDAVRRPGALLVPLGLWVAFAAWEWLVLVKSPEANIRVDLLLIWPIVLIATIWALIRTFR